RSPYPLQLGSGYRSGNWMHFAKL
uniref:Uncharacterized protein n=1 Tax=Amphimedon queenslandica TaxID=400682 RepID=A0A1X7T175_AMPQE